MKLYRCEVRKTVYIVADNALDAEQMAPGYAEEDDGEGRVIVSQATKRSIANDSAGGSLVYGRHTEDFKIEDALKLNARIKDSAKEKP